MTPRRAGFWLWVGAGLAVALAWDRAAWLHFSVRDADTLALLKERWWYLAVYFLGRLELWLLVAAALVLASLHRPTVGLRRGVVLILSAIAGGGLTELGKLVFRRLRPDAADGWYHFRSLFDRPLSSSGLGLPSSHAGVAFGAAFAMAWIFPRFRWLFVALAAACALSRVVAGAHFLSDVYVGAVLGWAAAWAVRRLDRSNNASVPGGA